MTVSHLKGTAYPPELFLQPVELGDEVPDAVGGDLGSLSMNRLDLSMIDQVEDEILLAPGVNDSLARIKRDEWSRETVRLREQIARLNPYEGTGGLLLSSRYALLPQGICQLYRARGDAGSKVGQEYLAMPVELEIYPVDAEGRAEVLAGLEELQALMKREGALKIEPMNFVRSVAEADQVLKSEIDQQVQESLEEIGGTPRDIILGELPLVGGFYGGSALFLATIFGLSLSVGVPLLVAGLSAWVLYQARQAKRKANGYHSMKLPLLGNKS